jgi:hypothetical protein
MAKLLNLFRWRRDRLEEDLERECATIWIVAQKT